MKPTVRQRATEAAQGLTDGPRWSLLRIAIDLGLMVGLAAVSEAVGHWAVTGLVIVPIGAIPLHDLLVHGHEAMHGNASHNRMLNSLILCFTHALVGISGNAHRSFHVDHHRLVGTDRDPVQCPSTDSPSSGHACNRSTPTRA